MLYIKHGNWHPQLKLRSNSSSLLLSREQNCATSAYLSRSTMCTRGGTLPWRGYSVPSVTLPYGRISLTSHMHPQLHSTGCIASPARGERVWCICHTRLVPFQDSVVTNEKFVRLNIVGIVRFFCDIYINGRVQSTSMWQKLSIRVVLQTSWITLF